MSKAFDAIVLGGGIIGAALADELGRRGQKVLLIERLQLGAEASTAAAGILSAQMDIRHPGPLSDLCRASRKMYPRWIEYLKQRSGGPVGYSVDGVVYVATTGREEAALDQQVKWQKKEGLRIERWSRNEVQRQEPALEGKFKKAYYFPTEAQVDTPVLMRALRTACVRSGVTLQEQTQVNKLIIENQVVKGVETDKGEFHSKVVVNCLGSWAHLEGQFPVHLPIQPAKGQMVSFMAPKRLFKHIVVSDKVYAVQRKDGRVLVGATVEFEGYEKGVTVEGLQALLSGLRYITKDALKDCTFLEAWSGLRPHTPDGLPILGSCGIEGLYMAAGHFKHGILLAPITAKVLAESILSKSSIDLTPFSADRFSKPAKSAARKRFL